MRAYAKDLQTIFTENFKGLVLYGNCEDVQDFIIWTCKIFSQTLDETVEWAHVEIRDFLENPNIYTTTINSIPSTSSSQVDSNVLEWLSPNIRQPNSIAKNH